MKKSLIALAVLAASGASFAQSSVTVYGTLDIALANVNGTGATTAAAANANPFLVTPAVAAAAASNVSQNLMASGGVSTPNFGFKGSEDLGHGLKANFKLEQGFNTDSGAAGTAGVAFNRYAYVGFSGGFGEVKLGRTGTAFDDINGAADAAFDANVLGPNNLAFKSTGYTWNPSNTIYYSTPAVAGFAGAISYSLGENKTATVDAGSIVSLNATYAAGPLALGAAYQTEQTNAAGVATDTVKFTRLNATYDIKVAKLLAAYGAKDLGDAAGSTTTEWSLGADVPVSSALTLSGGFARSTDNAAAGDGVRKAYSLAAAYSLSKRTTLYAGYGSTTTTAPGAADSDATILAAGVKHTF